VRGRLLGSLPVKVNTPPGESRVATPSGLAVGAEGGVGFTTSVVSHK